MSIAVNPAWNSAEALQTAIGQYKQQFDIAETNIRTCEQQRTLLEQQKHTLVGAIAALEQVLQNGVDEQKAAATKVAEPPGTPPPAVG